MEDSLISGLIQGGAVGVALAALYLVHSSLKDGRALIQQFSQDHKQSDAVLASAVKTLAEALVGNTEVTRSLKDVIDRKF